LLLPLTASFLHYQKSRTLPLVVVLSVVIKHVLMEKIYSIVHNNEEAGAWQSEWHQHTGAFGGTCASLQEHPPIASSCIKSSLSLSSVLLSSSAYCWENAGSEVS
jgi:hypothetical protein